MFLTEFLRFILDFFFSVTHNYGFSIILLSLTVTVIMLPLFWVAEVIQNIERARKEKMQPLFNEIKDVTNKQEKYYYTKEIYRKYEYRSFYALTGMVGLLIQVPFFLAAYWMILAYFPLQGASFGPIDDLYQPDQLISVGGLTINILPLVMTFTNLFAGYLYAKNKDKNERVQLMAISCVFLFLLYNLPAALVLYWTMNNVFGIGKNWLIANFKSPEMEFLLRKGFSRLSKINYFLYPLVLSTVPLLSIYLTNIGELYFSQLITLLCAILLATLVFLTVSKAVFKDKDKVVLLGFFTISLFFSFGHVRELLISLNIVFMAKIFVLSGIYAILLLLITFLLFRSARNLERITNALNILSFSLFSVIVFRILLYHIDTNDTDISHSSFVTVDEGNTGEHQHTKEPYPDIYYIVLDGYANSRILSNKLNFDNSNFEKNLKERGFFIAENGRANYVLTFLSLAATLNMDYINHLTDEVGVDSKDRKLPNQMISNNAVERYLKSKGYKTFNFKSGWGITNDMPNSDYSYASNSFLNDFSATFLQTTMLLPVVNWIASENYASNILYTFDHIDKTEKIKEPKFVFAHIVCPHPPYLFDQNGQSYPSEVKLNNSWDMNEKKYYLNQIKFVNKKVKEFVDGILSESKKSIIILQSDHGSAFLGRNWEKPSDAFIQERGKIFNAVLLNANGQKSMYSKISSVNTFRVVFNAVFDDDFQLLSDSTFFSTYDQPYKFVNVTELINSQE